MTETVKHTLEPWQVRTDLDGKPKLDSRDGYTVERAGPTAGKPFVVSTWSLTNARLIAAAPEMLEALKECLPLFDMVTALDDHGSNALGQAENLIRAAISMAEGGAS